MTMQRGAVQFLVSAAVLALGSASATPSPPPIGREETVLRLREAAANGRADSQRMLATLLESGTPREQQEALDWYLVAWQGGDARAQLRYRELKQRLVQPPRPGASDAPTSEAASQPAGYHCHFLSMGIKWCHAGADRAGF